MPKFLKYILYFIGGYAVVLGLISLINTNSKCNIISSGSCSVLDTIQMVMWIPLVIPSVMFENKNEADRTAKLQAELKEGVMRGDRESIESCLVDGCFLGPPIDDPKPQETEKYRKMSAEKLITFDHIGNPPLEDRKQEYLMMAYLNLSETEDVNSEKYQKYIHRAWQLLIEYNNKNEDRLNIYKEVITAVGGSAFLLKHDLFAKEYSDKSVQEVFDGCMFDPFWKQAKYNSQSTDTEILHSCMSALSEYLYRKKLDPKLSKPFDEKWHDLWNKNFKN